MLLEINAEVESVCWFDYKLWNLIIYSVSNVLFSEQDCVLCVLAKDSSPTASPKIVTPAMDSDIPQPLSLGYDDTESPLATESSPPPYVEPSMPERRSESDDNATKEPVCFVSCWPCACALWFLGLTFFLLKLNIRSSSSSVISIAPLHRCIETVHSWKWFLQTNQKIK